MKYENNNLEVLGLIPEGEVQIEQAAFNDMEENYEAAINEAKRIIKGKVEAEDERDSQPERAIQLTSQRKSLQDQARGILDAGQAGQEAPQSRGEVQMGRKETLSHQARRDGIGGNV